MAGMVLTVMTSSIIMEPFLAHAWSQSLTAPEPGFIENVIQWDDNDIMNSLLLWKNIEHGFHTYVSQKLTLDTDKIGGFLFKLQRVRPLESWKTAERIKVELIQYDSVLATDVLDWVESVGSPTNIQWLFASPLTISQWVPIYFRVSVDNAEFANTAPSDNVFSFPYYVIGSNNVNENGRPNGFWELYYFDGANNIATDSLLNLQVLRWGEYNLDFEKTPDYLFPKLQPTPENEWLLNNVTHFSYSPTLVNGHADRNALMSLCPSGSSDIPKPDDSGDIITDNFSKRPITSEELTRLARDSTFLYNSQDGLLGFPGLDSAHRVQEYDTSINWKITTGDKIFTFRATEDFSYDAKSVFGMKRPFPEIVDRDSLPVYEKNRGWLKVLCVIDETKEIAGLDTKILKVNETTRLNALGLGIDMTNSLTPDNSTVRTILLDTKVSTFKNSWVVVSAGDVIKVFGKSKVDETGYNTPNGSTSADGQRFWHFVYKIGANGEVKDGGEYNLVKEWGELFIGVKDTNDSLTDNAWELKVVIEPLVSTNSLESPSSLYVNLRRNLYSLWVSLEKADVNGNYTEIFNNNDNPFKINPLKVHGFDKLWEKVLDSEWNGASAIATTVDGIYVLKGNKLLFLSSGIEGNSNEQRIYTINKNLSGVKSLFYLDGELYAGYSDLWLNDRLSRIKFVSNNQAVVETIKLKRGEWLLDKDRGDIEGIGVTKTNYLLNTDGRYVYSLSHNKGSAKRANNVNTDYNAVVDGLNDDIGYNIRVYDPRNNWSLIKNTFVKSPAFAYAGIDNNVRNLDYIWYNTEGFIVDESFIYVIQEQNVWAGDIAKVIVINKDTFDRVSDFNLTKNSTTCQNSGWSCIKRGAWSFMTNEYVALSANQDIAKIEFIRVAKDFKTAVILPFQPYSQALDFGSNNKYRVKYSYKFDEMFVRDILYKKNVEDNIDNGSYKAKGINLRNKLINVTIPQSVLDITTNNEVSLWVNLPISVNANSEETGIDWLNKMVFKVGPENNRSEYKFTEHSIKNNELIVWGDKAYNEMSYALHYYFINDTDPYLTVDVIARNEWEHEAWAWYNLDIFLDTQKELFYARRSSYGISYRGKNDWKESGFFVARKEHDWGMANNFAANKIYLTKWLSIPAKKEKRIGRFYIGRYDFESGNNLPSLHSVGKLTKYIYGRSIDENFYWGINTNLTGSIFNEDGRMNSVQRIPHIASNYYHGATGFPFIDLADETEFLPRDIELDFERPKTEIQPGNGIGQGINNLYSNASNSTSLITSFTRDFNYYQSGGQLDTTSLEIEEYQNGDRYNGLEHMNGKLVPSMKDGWSADNWIVRRFEPTSTTDFNGVVCTDIAGNDGSDKTATLSLTRFFPVDTQVSFNIRGVTQQDPGDKFYFFVGTTPMINQHYHYHVNSNVTFTIPKWLQTLRWQYVKDDLNNGHISYDRVCIDNLAIASLLNNSKEEMFNDKIGTSFIVPGYNQKIGTVASGSTMLADEIPGKIKIIPFENDTIVQVVPYNNNGQRAWEVESYHIKMVGDFVEVPVWKGAAFHVLSNKVVSVLMDNFYTDINKTGNLSSDKSPAYDSQNGSKFVIYLPWEKDGGTSSVVPENSKWNLYISAFNSAEDSDEIEVKIEDLTNNKTNYVGSIKTLKQILNGEVSDNWMGNWQNNPWVGGSWSGSTWSWQQGWNVAQEPQVIISPSWTGFINPDSGTTIENQPVVFDVLANDKNRYLTTKAITANGWSVPNNAEAISIDENGKVRFFEINSFQDYNADYYRVYPFMQPSYTNWYKDYKYSVKIIKNFTGWVPAPCYIKLNGRVECSLGRAKKKIDYFEQDISQGFLENINTHNSGLNNNFPGISSSGIINIAETESSIRHSFHTGWRVYGSPNFYFDDILIKNYEFWHVKASLPNVSSVEVPVVRNAVKLLNNLILTANWELYAHNNDNSVSLIWTGITDIGVSYSDLQNKEKLYYINYNESQYIYYPEEKVIIRWFPYAKIDDVISLSGTTIYDENAGITINWQINSDLLIREDDYQLLADEYFETMKNKYGQDIRRHNVHPILKFDGIHENKYNLDTDVWTILDTYFPNKNFSDYETPLDNVNWRHSRYNITGNQRKYKGILNSRYIFDDLIPGAWREKIIVLKEGKPFFLNEQQELMELWFSLEETPIEMFSQPDGFWFGNFFYRGKNNKTYVVGRNFEFLNGFNVRTDISKFRKIWADGTKYVNINNTPLIQQTIVEWEIPFPNVKNIINIKFNSHVWWDSNANRPSTIKVWQVYVLLDDWDLYLYENVHPKMTVSEVTKRSNYRRIKQNVKDINSSYLINDQNLIEPLYDKNDDDYDFYYNGWDSSSHFEEFNDWATAINDLTISIPDSYYPYITAMWKDGSVYQWGGFINKYNYETMRVERNGYINHSWRVLFDNCRIGDYYNNNSNTFRWLHRKYYNVRWGHSWNVYSEHEEKCFLDFSLFTAWQDYNLSNHPYETGGERVAKALWRYSSGNYGYLIPYGYNKFFKFNWVKAKKLTWGYITNQIETFTQPENGVVDIYDGKLRYTPNFGFSGEDVFTYTTQLWTTTVTVLVKPFRTSNFLEYPQIWEWQILRITAYKKGSNYETDPRPVSIYYGKWDNPAITEFVSADGRNFKYPVKTTSYTDYISRYLSFYDNNKITVSNWEWEILDTNSYDALQWNTVAPAEQIDENKWNKVYWKGNISLIAWNKSNSVNYAFPLKAIDKIYGVWSRYIFKPFAENTSIIVIPDFTNAAGNNNWGSGSLHPEELTNMAVYITDKTDNVTTRLEWFWEFPLQKDREFEVVSENPNQNFYVYVVVGENNSHTFATTYKSRDGLQLNTPINVYQNTDNFFVKYETFGDFANIKDEPIEVGEINTTSAYLQWAAPNLNPAGNWLTNITLKPNEKIIINGVMGLSEGTDTNWWTQHIPEDSDIRFSPHYRNAYYKVWANGVKPLDFFWQSIKAPHQANFNHREDLNKIESGIYGNPDPNNGYEITTWYHNKTASNINFNLWLKAENEYNTVWAIYKKYISNWKGETNWTKLDDYISEDKNNPVVLQTFESTGTYPKFWWLPTLAKRNLLSIEYSSKATQNVSNIIKSGTGVLYNNNDRKIIYTADITQGTLSHKPQLGNTYKIKFQEKDNSTTEHSDLYVNKNTSLEFTYKNNWQTNQKTALVCATVKDNVHNEKNLCITSYSHFLAYYTSWEDISNQLSSPGKVLFIKWVIGESIRFVSWMPTKINILDLYNELYQDGTYPISIDGIEISSFILPSQIWRTFENWEISNLSLKQWTEKDIKLSGATSLKYISENVPGTQNLLIGEFIPGTENEEVILSPQHYTIRSFAEDNSASISTTTWFIDVIDTSSGQSAPFESVIKSKPFKLNGGTNYRLILSALGTGNKLIEVRGVNTNTKYLVSTTTLKNFSGKSISSIQNNWTLVEDAKDYTFAINLDRPISEDVELLIHSPNGSYSIKEAKIQNLSVISIPQSVNWAIETGKSPLMYKKSRDSKTISQNEWRIRNYFVDFTKRQGWDLSQSIPWLWSVLTDWAMWQQFIFRFRQKTKLNDVQALHWYISELIPDNKFININATNWDAIGMGQGIQMGGTSFYSPRDEKKLVGLSTLWVVIFNDKIVFMKNNMNLRCSHTQSQYNMHNLSKSRMMEDMCYYELDIKKGINTIVFLTEDDIGLLSTLNLNSVKELSGETIHEELSTAINRWPGIPWFLHYWDDANDFLSANYNSIILGWTSNKSYTAYSPVELNRDYGKYNRPYIVTSTTPSKIIKWERNDILIRWVRSRNGISWGYMTSQLTKRNWQPITWPNSYWTQRLVMSTGTSSLKNIEHGDILEVYFQKNIDYINDIPAIRVSVIGQWANVPITESKAMKTFILSTIPDIQAKENYVDFLYKHPHSGRTYASDIIVENTSEIHNFQWYKVIVPLWNFLNDGITDIKTVQLSAITDWQPSIEPVIFWDVVITNSKDEKKGNNAKIEFDLEKILAKDTTSFEVNMSNSSNDRDLSGYKVVFSKWNSETCIYRNGSLLWSCVANENSRFIEGVDNIRFAFIKQWEYIWLVSQSDKIDGNGELQPAIEEIIKVKDPNPLNINKAKALFTVNDGKLRISNIRVLDWESTHKDDVLHLKMQSVDLSGTANVYAVNHYWSSRNNYLHLQKNNEITDYYVPLHNITNNMWYMTDISVSMQNYWLSLGDGELRINEFNIISRSNLPEVIVKNNGWEIIGQTTIKSGQTLTTVFKNDKLFIMWLYFKLQKVKNQAMTHGLTMRMYPVNADGKIDKWTLIAEKTVNVDHLSSSEWTKVKITFPAVAVEKNRKYAVELSTADVNGVYIYGSHRNAYLEGYTTVSVDDASIQDAFEFNDGREHPVSINWRIAKKEKSYWPSSWEYSDSWLSAGNKRLIIKNRNNWEKWLVYNVNALSLKRERTIMIQLRELEVDNNIGQRVVYEQKNKDGFYIEGNGIEGNNSWSPRYVFRIGDNCKFIFHGLTLSANDNIAISINENTNMYKFFKNGTLNYWFRLKDKHYPFLTHLGNTAMDCPNLDAALELRDNTSTSPFIFGLRNHPASPQNKIGYDYIRYYSEALDVARDVLPKISEFSRVDANIHYDVALGLLSKNDTRDTTDERTYDLWEWIVREIDGDLYLDWLDNGNGVKELLLKGNITFRVKWNIYVNADRIYVLNDKNKTGDSSISYIWFISDNDIIINSNVEHMEGGYFARNAIKTISSETQLKVKGSLAAKEIDLQNRTYMWENYNANNPATHEDSVILEFDNRVYKRMPPLFYKSKTWAGIDIVEK